MKLPSDSLQNPLAPDVQRRLHTGNTRGNTVRRSLCTGIKAGQQNQGNYVSLLVHLYCLSLDIRIYGGSGPAAGAHGKYDRSRACHGITASEYAGL